MRKNFLYAILCAASIAMTSTTVAYATEDAQQLTQEVDQALLEASKEPIPEVKKEIVESAFTAYSDKTSSMICVTAIVPENFGENVYTQVRNFDTGTVYNLPMYAANGYFERCYVPAGNYSFLIVAAYGDNANTYSFDFPKNQFYVEAKQSAEFEITLQDFETVEAKLEQKYADVPENVEKVNLSNTSKSKEHVVSDFEVIYTGTGLGEVGVIGEQDDEYEFMIKIEEAGKLGSGSFAYSLNQGKTWSEINKIPLSGFYEFGSSGLVLEFFLPNDDADFVAGDIYECYVPDPGTKIVIDQEGNSDVDLEVISNTDNMRVFDVLEQMDVKIAVKIVKGGTFGEAVWQLSKDGGRTWSAEEYAKDEIVITSDIDPTLSVKLKFTMDGSVNGFVRGDIFEIYAKRDNGKSVTAAITMLFVLLVAAGSVGVIGYKKMKDAIPSNDDYKLRK